MIYGREVAVGQYVLSRHCHECLNKLGRIVWIKDALAYLHIYNPSPEMRHNNTVHKRLGGEWVYSTTYLLHDVELHDPAVDFDDWCAAVHENS